MIYRAPPPVAPEAPAPEPQREVITLSVAGLARDVTASSVVLGRSRNADIQIDDANVSRRHAELRQEGTSYWIVDLGSTNGLEVNGKRVDRKRLRDGDRITLGATEVVFGRSLPS
jgi:pSer/pThr/pTyr-binding forkhead associated (FHA) protein